MYIALFWPQPE